MTHPGLNSGAPRPDAAAKAMGRARYCADVQLTGMLHGVIVPSPVSSGILSELDVSAAEAAPGVVAVVTAANLPGNNRIGLIFDDQPLLVTDRVRMAGDRIALIAATTPEAAQRAARLVKFIVDPLPGVHDVRRALDEKSPLVQEQGNLLKEFFVKRGAPQTCRDADIVLEDEFVIGGQEHAYLETQGTVAEPQPDGTWVLHSTTQCPFYIRGRVARFLGLPISSVRVRQTVTGGGFGGKEDYPDEPAMCAVALAKVTGRPVSLILPRGQDMQMSTKRHAMVVRHKLYANLDGRIRGVEIQVLVDAGAYGGLSTVVAERANISSVGPYDIEHVSVLTQVIYTNNLFGGPYRGFGAPQVAAAHEAQMDRLARTVGLDPFEIRRLNGVSAKHPEFTSGETLAQAHLYGQLLDRLEAESGWKREKAAIAASRDADPDVCEGIGLATIIYGVNLHWGGSRLDRGGAYVLIQADGTVNVAVGITEMGQGALAAMRTICAAALGIDETRVQITEVDTALVPDSGPTVASRATVSGGNAVVDAARQLNERLLPLAAGKLGRPGIDGVVCKGGVYSHPEAAGTVTFEEIVTLLYGRRQNPGALGWFSAPDRVYDPATGQGSAYAFYTFGGHVVRVRVDRATGQVTVREVTAAHDVGRVIHGLSAEGQVHGGVVQGLGWALTEELKLDGGRLKNPGFTDYLIPTSMDIPEKINIIFLEEPEPQGPFGAKGLGEPTFISVGAATLNAVAHALGREVSCLPLTPERVVQLTRPEPEERP
ncbi:xanthine dehydrogenase family protein molybdopterin-binding subunit [Myxococcota bacterium]|nr:xanthine dehydrogenase family protein molybdopterin-binding subunit [Myxococcota bacterium]